MSQMNKIQIGVDREDYFLQEIHWVDDNSFENFTTYWQQQDWEIIVQQLLVTFFIDISS